MTDVQTHPVCNGPHFGICAINPAHATNCGVPVFAKRIVNAICTECGLVQNVSSLPEDELDESRRAMTRNVEDGVKVDYRSLPIKEIQHDYVLKQFQLSSDAFVFEVPSAEIVRKFPWLLDS